MANQPKQTEASHNKLQNKTLYRAQTRRTLALAGQEELRLKTLEGRLVDLDLIRRSLEGVMINQRTILLNLPAQIGRDLDDPELRVRVCSIVDRHVREALELLATYDPGVQRERQQRAS